MPDPTDSPPGPDNRAPLAHEHEQVFDVCHGGVLLRTVLFVHAALAVGLAFTSRGWLGWLNDLSLAAAAALPAALLWVTSACLARRQLARLPRLAQWAVVVPWGSACAAYGWGLLVWLDLAPVLGLGWLAPLLAGAALAGLVFHWLVQRAELQMPATTLARLAELQSRIRPHFLFNTLNSAIALVRIDPERAEAVLEDLAELFRAALQTQGETASLGEEIALAERYLAVEAVRFGDRLRLRWELDPAASSARLPVMVLQPLVENAVRHGVESAPDGGAIRIKTRARHGQILVEITNTVPEQAQARPGAGMALRNVRERLFLLHDVAQKFEAGLVEPGRYRVRIVCPLAAP